MVGVQAEEVPTGTVCKMQCGCIVKATDEGDGGLGGLSTRIFDLLERCNNELVYCDLHDFEIAERRVYIQSCGYTVVLDYLVAELYSKFNG